MQPACQKLNLGRPSCFTGVHPIPEHTTPPRNNPKLDFRPDVVVYIYNPSYSGGRGQSEQSFQDLSSTTTKYKTKELDMWLRW
jgi:hypothetical protein